MTKLILGDCKDSLKKFPDNYFHSVVCDPPYLIEFMGKSWDKSDGSSGVSPFEAWFAGFVAGEGYFRIHKEKQGKYYACHFGIHLRADDAPVLRAIQKRLGIGKISTGPSRISKYGINSAPDVRWVIQSRSDCWELTKIFDRMPLFAKKAREYKLWRKALECWTNQPKGNRWTGSRNKPHMKKYYEEMKNLRPFDEELALDLNDPFAPPMQQFHYEWATEVLRVLRPGGILLAFGGSRTSHRLACAIEDAGFEIRDSIIWMYGSGFPKSLNVGKAIDKAAGAKREVVGRRTDGRYAYGFEGTANRPTGAQADTVDAKRIGGFVSDKAIITAPATDAAATWDGWGTALKPAHEPIVMARKPLSESTVAKNVLRWGTGALNIDASRISPTGERLGGGGEKKATFKKSEGWSRPWMQDEKHVKQHAQKVIDNVEHASALGRWPANLVLVHHDDCKEVGTKKIKGHKGYPNGPGGFYSKEYQENSQVTADWNQFSTKEHDKPWKGHADEHGNETIPDWDCHPECPVRVLDEQSGDRPSTMTGAKEGKDYTSKARSSGLFGHMKQGNLYSDSGGASRFFYQAKASNKERFFLCKDCGVVGNKRKLHTDHNIVFHPTQKPLALMSYLVRMVTPPGGRVLDPFMGSGTTVVAATTDGFQATGIEKEQDYVTIARSRLKAAEPIKPLAGLEV